MSAFGASPDREALSAADRLLEDRGFTSARAGVAGARGEILVVEAPAPDIVGLAELAPELKALGFRYVAVDLLSVSEATLDTADAAGR